MIKTKTITESFQDVAILFNGEVEYCDMEIDAVVAVEIDRNYGADRDGNRGIERVTFAEVTNLWIVGAAMDGTPVKLQWSDIKSFAQNDIQGRLVDIAVDAAFMGRF